MTSTRLRSAPCRAGESRFIAAPTPAALAGMLAIAVAHRRWLRGHADEMTSASHRARERRGC